MVDLCNLVFVDVQALIRVFDPVDGTVRLVGLKETGFFRLLPSIGVLKASAEEAPYVDVEEARKWCCVLVTNGKDGEMQIPAFPSIEVDPTGAGDSFLGGFVAGLVNGLDVHDSALLGNFFGSVTVGQLGFPKLESMMLQRVKDEVEKRRLCIICTGLRTEMMIMRMHSNLICTGLRTENQEPRKPTKPMKQGTVTRSKRFLRSNVKIIWNKLSAMSGRILNKVRLNSCTATESMSPPTTNGANPEHTMPRSSTIIHRTTDQFLLVQTLRGNLRYSRLKIQIYDVHLKPYSGGGLVERGDITKMERLKLLLRAYVEIHITFGRVTGIFNFL